MVSLDGVSFFPDRWQRSGLYGQPITRSPPVPAPCAASAWCSSRQNSPLGARLKRFTCSQVTYCLRLCCRFQHPFRENARQLFPQCPSTVNTERLESLVSDFICHDQPIANRFCWFSRLRKQTTPKKANRPQKKANRRWKSKPG